MNDEQLIEAAKEARQNAHAPYSKYSVGAAIIDENGDVHKGCNVENAAYPEGNCAEANAIGAMIAAGGKKISVIAAVGGSDSLEFCTPCGGCRQSILEFSGENLSIRAQRSQRNVGATFRQDGVDQDPTERALLTNYRRSSE